MRLLPLVAFFICWLFAYPTQSKANPGAPERAISEKKLAKWQADEDFKYSKETDVIKPRRNAFQVWLRNLITQLGLKDKMNWDYVMYGLAFIVLCFLIYYVVKGNRTAVFAAPSASLSFLGVADSSASKLSLHEQWLQAEQTKDFGLALRLMALMAFKQGKMQQLFAQNETVTLAKIIHKIKEHSIYQPLVSLFQTIEFVYYGAYPLHPELYQELKLVFLNTFDSQSPASET